MKLSDLSFADYAVVAPNIVEVITHEGIEIDEKMMKQAEAALIEHFGTEEYGILVNRRNAYSHTVDSMLYAANLKNLRASAIVAYSASTMNAASVHRSFDKRIQTFTDRELALEWLSSLF